MKSTLVLLTLAFAAPVSADCPEPTEEQKEQLRWCETHPGCMIDAKIAKDCAGVTARIREFFSSSKKEIESPEYGEGDLEKERRARAEQAALPVDRRTPAEIKRAEQFHATKKAEADAINAMGVDDRICGREPFGDACNAAIETYLARRARVAAYRKEYGIWNKEIEDLRLTFVEDAIEARAIRAQNAARAVKRDVSASPDLASVDVAIKAYERYDAQRPQREAAEQVAAARQKAVDDENARRYAAELAQRDAESREALQDSLKALVQSIEVQSAPASENQAPPRSREQQDCGVYDGNGVYVGPHSC